MSARVILDRDLAPSWMDAALRLKDVSDPAKARKELADALSEAGLGETALTKTVTALARSWIDPDQGARSLVESARTFDADGVDTAALHFGVLLATQPFFLDLTRVTGLALIGHDSVTTPDLRRRMKQSWGSRRSVDVAVQRCVKTMRLLGLLRGAPSESLSTRGTLVISNPRVSSWVVACLLAGRGTESIGAADISLAPELFGVHLPTTLPRTSPWLVRHAEGGGRSVYALPA